MKLSDRWFRLVSIVFFRYILIVTCYDYVYLKKAEWLSIYFSKNIKYWEEWERNGNGNGKQTLPVLLNAFMLCPETFFSMAAVDGVVHVQVRQDLYTILQSSKSNAANRRIIVHTYIHFVFVYSRAVVYSC